MRKNLKKAMSVIACLALISAVCIAYGTESKEAQPKSKVDSQIEQNDVITASGEQSSDIEEPEKESSAKEKNATKKSTIDETQKTVASSSKTPVKSSSTSKEPTVSSAKEPSSSESTSSSKPSTEKPATVKPTPAPTPTPSKPTHTHDSHGNICGWKNTAAEVEAVYVSKINYWGSLYETGQCSKEEYKANCPIGWTGFTCSCGLWSGNYKYY